MVALSTVPVGFCLGAIEVAIPAFSAEEGSAALAGVLLAIWSASSGVGGLFYGAWSAPGAALRLVRRDRGALPARLPADARGVVTVAMGLFVVLAGAPIAPLIASRNLVVGALSPAGTGAESFTWLMTALVAGLAAGNAAGGALIEAEGWPAAVLDGLRRRGDRGGGGLRVPPRAAAAARDRLSAEAYGPGSTVSVTVVVSGGAVVVSVTVSSVVVVVSVVVVSVLVVTVVVVGVSVEVLVSVCVTKTSSVGGSATISARATPSPIASAASPISAAFVRRSAPGRARARSRWVVGVGVLPARGC